MRTTSRILVSVPALVLAASWTVPAAQAQETLAGVGAASAMGAGLGAAAAGGASAGRLAGRGGGMGAMSPDGNPTDGSGSGPMMPGAAAMAGAIPGMAPTTTRSVTPFAGIPNGNALLGQLMSVPFQAPLTRRMRSPRAQATYSRRVSRLSPTSRKKLVLGKYKIGPRGWLSSYLPQDRYKFSKAWKFVSTETDRFYYSPQSMARRRFSPNRVIGFRTWQDAMLAGYRPDPASKPAPGSQLAFFASMTRDEPLVHYLEYAYSGQVSPSSLDATYRYVRRVKTIIDRNPQVRQYQRTTVNSILEAALTGDSSLIPTVLGQPAPTLVMNQPSFPGMTGPPPGMSGPPPGSIPMGVPQGPPPGAAVAPPVMGMPPGAARGRGGIGGAGVGA